MNLSAILLEFGRYEVALEAAAEARVWAERFGAPSFTVGANAFASAAHLALGQVDETETVARAALDAERRVPMAIGRLVASTALIQALVRSGRLEAALEALDDALMNCHLRIDYFALRLKLAEAEVHEAMDDAISAENAVRQALAHIPDESASAQLFRMLPFAARLLPEEFEAIRAKAGQPGAAIFHALLEEADALVHRDAEVMERAARRYRVLKMSYEASRCEAARVGLVHEEVT
jgi:tetratricopeptide (TPR) repeat protein